MPPNYFSDAFLKNFERFKTLSPEELSARYLTTYTLRPTGGGEMKPFKETVSQDGKSVGESATELAIKYSLEHPKSDASENFLNYLMAGEIGLGRSVLTGTAQSTINGLLNTLPKLSFSNTYTTGTGLSTTPTMGAIYADVGLAAATTAPSVYDISKNGLNWVNGTETTLGMLPVFSNILRFTRGVNEAFKAEPIVMKGYNAVKRIYDNGTLWDKYTTLSGRFGYYGNPLQRVWGTVSRNLGISSSPKHPELLRKLGEIPRSTEEGLLDFNSTRTDLLGKGHSNWTLDRPVVSHKNSNWDGKDLFIVDPVEFLNAIPRENVISIEPSDMFVLNADAFINPKRVTVVSGNPEILIQARKMGMSTLSSPRLRRLYKPEKPKVGRFSFDKGNYGNRPYALEQLRLQLRRGAPTIDDFSLIENLYGLKAGVIPMSEYLLNPLSIAIKNMLLNPTLIRSWTYPNGREILLIPGGTYLDKSLYEESLVNKAPYKNVFYDPASHVEINSGVTNRGNK